MAVLQAQEEKEEQVHAKKMTFFLELANGSSWVSSFWICFCAYDEQVED